MSGMQSSCKWDQGEDGDLRSEQLSRTFHKVTVTYCLKREIRKELREKRRKELGFRHYLFPTGESVS
jgi:hypothetical protein